jgi:hypothetical protein
MLFIHSFYGLFCFSKINRNTLILFTILATPPVTARRSLASEAIETIYSGLKSIFLAHIFSVLQFETMGQQGLHESRLLEKPEIPAVKDPLPCLCYHAHLKEPGLSPGDFFQRASTIYFHYFSISN